MKEGLAYISKRTNQLRYASGASEEDANFTGITSNNPDEQWLQQVSIYYAREEIKRGDPVSVTTLSNEGLEEDPNSYIVKTDSSIHTKCIGIALEYAKTGAAVHVQPFGKFIYDDSKSSDREHKFSDDISGSYNTLVGKVVYIGQKAGTFTIDFEQAYANGRNIIQVGVITDAPANESQHEYAIELQPEADGRGPLDSTQFEFEIGETVEFKPNEIKVFAIAGPKNEQPFIAKIAGNPPNGFIMFEPVDGGTPTVYGNYNRLSEADISRLSKYSPQPIPTNPVPPSFTGAGQKDYNIYISSNAKNYVSVSVSNRPQPAETGKAVLAHAGCSSRSQIIGVYKNGSKPKTFKAGENIKLIKQGLIKSAGLEPGKKYYLTDQGNIELNPNPLYDTLLVVGTTNNSRDLIVDCHNSVNAHAGVKPVGYIKPLEEGQSPEYGYLSMNNQTYPKNDYIALCNFLERCDKLSVSGDNFILNNPGYQIKYVDEGYADTSIPRVPYLVLEGTFASNTVSNSTLSLNPQTSKCALAVEGKGYDISSLVYWSPMGINGATTDVNLSSFDIHLSVKIDSKSNKTVEIYPGFHQYESNVYGFNWVVEFDESANKYILKVDTGDKGNFGIAYIADPKRAPTKLNDKSYEIYVSRRDNGYTSIDLVKSVLGTTDQTYNPNSTLPASGRAVSAALSSARDISSKLEAKYVLGASRNIVPSDYGELASNFDLADNEYNSLLQDDTIASKALYEINSIIYKYIDGHENAKPFIGILIDQLRKIVETDKFDADHSHILINDSNTSLESYKLTEDQKNDIKKILDLLTNDKESAQVVSSSIGLLIKAASETQKRLLNIESALFGRDYETLPDSKTQKDTPDVYPAEGIVSSLPARIGITRVVNALSKETLGSDNPTGDAANPDNSSNNNRIKDLYKQIEGTNGDYGETGIELNLLTGEDNSFINSGDSTDAGQHGTGAIGDSKNEISKGTFNTYPNVEYGTESGTQLTAPNGFAYISDTPKTPSDKSNNKYKMPLKGINDALNRIMYKLNMLTSDIHGYDDILSKPVRLDNIRSRLNQVFLDSYVKKSKYFNINEKKDILDSIIVLDPINNLSIATDENSYNPNFNPLDLPELESIRTIYFSDLYTKWAGGTDDQRIMDPFTDAGSICNGIGTIRTPIIELIKSTIGNPKAFSSEQQEHISDPSTYKSFVASRNIHSHSERLYNLETAVDTLITALFHGKVDDINAKADDTYSNLSEIISSPDDTIDKADITRVQQEWNINNGFKTLNQLIYGGETPNSENNVIQTIIRELTGNSSATTSGFTTSTPTTFIDIFKKFLETNHYNNLTNVSATDLNDRLIAADHVFDLTANGINYNTSSVLSNNDLTQRNIFYAKASENITGSIDSFVKAYHFKADVVYQFYKTGDKFGLVNDYTEITLAAGESIKIHGQNDNAYATVTADGNGNLDIKASQVSTLVIPTTNSSSSVPTGALYIKEE